MRKKDNQKFQNILEEAARLVIEGGIANASTNKIAKGLNISQSSIYIYFKNREEIMLTLYLRELKRMYAEIEFDGSNMPVEEALRKSIRLLFAYASKNLDRMQLIIRLKDAMKSDSPIVNAVKSIVDASQVQQMMYRGIKNRDLRQLDISFHRNNIFSTVMLHAQNIQNGVYTEKEVPLKQVEDMIVAAEIE
ncbi:TetR/AcrR family transcriptional regulator [Pediococcus claussenii]|uniref:Transcriptional regulator, TetR family n=1 Tax=Pediococcus claussenii (strain ATCC BAA-344 / DSM 14800 / JCM 18046 / KCTC 3811 / LMG 21948 / P06) TaxID=701521 RepID=G8PBG3_PEDCP|nr:TetR/AcrR family transcriptional regulator [Pediococcus claussenii]AEV95952.1 Transcriptional regulator, TetR family [Pediococcus claussenii ATCC BAA-344]ANZ69441.1 hypothetical protein AYR57_03570 [Pediococcus claussenii]ANZ71261.1 hypothetical protein AYR58_03585 [Pediococcus claussenii]KRN20559.1 hypothetical protein IV79_GL000617 [Pediococcus claussenii]